MLWIINKFNKFPLFENSNKTPFSRITNIVPSRITYTSEINKKTNCKMCSTIVLHVFLLSFDNFFSASE